MKAKKPTEKTTRKRTSDEFKDQALKRAERDGVALVTRDLGIAETQITAWRRKRQIEGAVTETERLKEAEVAPYAGSGASGRGEHFLKKSLGVLRSETIEVKYALIRRHEGQHAIALMCDLLSVSRSGYYEWRGRPTPPRTKAGEPPAGHTAHLS